MKHRHEREGVVAYLVHAGRESILDGFLSETVPRHAGVRIEEPDLHSTSSLKAKAPILLASSRMKGLSVHMCGDPQYPACSVETQTTRDPGNNLIVPRSAAKTCRI